MIRSLSGNECLDSRTLRGTEDVLLQLVDEFAAEPLVCELQTQQLVRIESQKHPQQLATARGYGAA